MIVVGAWGVGSAASGASSVASGACSGDSGSSAVGGAVATASCR